MAPPPEATEDRGWEKAFAPRISSKHLVLAAIVNGLWIAFLAALAAGRWFGSLQ
jgi:hypothetical protein